MVFINAKLGSIGSLDFFSAKNFSLEFKFRKIIIVNLLLADFFEQEAKVNAVKKRNASRKNILTIIFFF